MAWLMRNVCLILVSLLGLAGCSPTQPVTRTRDAHARLAAHAHYASARALQLVIMQHHDHELLDESGQKLVLKLADAQTCLASGTRDPHLAAQTHSMLDAYLALHEKHGSEPSPQLLRKVQRAQRDAEVAGQGVASLYFLGCEPLRPTLSGGPGPEYHLWDTKGARPAMFDGQRVPGGVIK